MAFLKNTVNPVNYLRVYRSGGFLMYPENKDAEGNEIPAYMVLKIAYHIYESADKRNAEKAGTDPFIAKLPGNAEYTGAQIVMPAVTTGLTIEEIFLKTAYLSMLNDPKYIDAGWVTDEIQP